MKKSDYKALGVDESKLIVPFGDANICVQLFGHRGSDDSTQYHALNFMPRKERCCEFPYDVSKEGDKKALIEYLEESCERYKIAIGLMQAQVKELKETGKISTTFYYWKADEYEDAGIEEID